MEKSQCHAGLCRKVALIRVEGGRAKGFGTAHLSNACMAGIARLYLFKIEGAIAARAPVNLASGIPSVGPVWPYGVMYLLR